MDVSIVIRAYNEEKWIGNCLESVFSQEFEGSVEVIIVDSGSTDKTLDIAGQFDLRIIKIPKEKFSYGYALNVGCKNARGKYIISLTAHVIPANKKWLYFLIRGFDTPEIAGVYGRQIPPSDCNPLDKRILLQADHFLGNHKKIQTKSFIFSNTTGAIRKDLWERCPFDESITFKDDKVWAKEVMTNGYKIVYEPRAVVIHPHDLSILQTYRRAWNTGHGPIMEDKRYTFINDVILHALVTTGCDWKFIIKNRENPIWLLISPIRNLTYFLGLYNGYKSKRSRT